MKQMQVIKTQCHRIAVLSDESSFSFKLEHLESSAGIDLIRLELSSALPAKPPRCRIEFYHPLKEIVSSWSPLSNLHGGHWRNGLETNYYDGFISKATSQAPVRAYLDAEGTNRLCYSLSETLRPVRVRGGVDEPTSELSCAFELFIEPEAPFTSYSCILRIDTRDVHWAEAVMDTSHWWTTFPGMQALSAPIEASYPLYSTWYSFHKTVNASAVERQCEIAASLGMKAVILDDGWQADDNQGGYWYAGDWTAAPGKFPDMASHVAKVKAMGMKYLLWYALPFLGTRSLAWKQFQEFTLPSERSDCRIFDLRYPQVRKHLVECLVRNVTEYGVDGFKLDFVDSIPETPMDEKADPRRDIATHMDAFEALMGSAVEKLKKIKPEIMIEFRQKYVGPVMRKYANIFRASDCANCTISNHLRTLDTRLLVPGSIVHSDMMMWNHGESAESAARQVLASLFAVPQISRLLDKLPEMHTRMLFHWLKFMDEYRDVLLHGQLHIDAPESGYQTVIASKGTRRVAAAYYSPVIDPGTDVPMQLALVNVTGKNHLVLDLSESIGTRRITIRNVIGETVKEMTLNLTAGIHSLPVPPSGLAILTA